MSVLQFSGRITWVETVCEGRALIPLIQRQGNDAIRIFHKIQHSAFSSPTNFRIRFCGAAGTANIDGLLEGKAGVDVADSSRRTLTKLCDGMGIFWSGWKRWDSSTPPRPRKKLYRFYSQALIASSMLRVW